jgi:hypothetical protein
MATSELAEFALLLALWSTPVLLVLGVLLGIVRLVLQYRP